MKKSGIWAGGAFCVLAILCLALGTIPLLRAYFYKPFSIQIPGQSTLNIALPGTYIGLATLAGRSPEEKQKALNLDYWLSDASEKEYLKVNKFPARSYYSEKEDASTPLFEIILDKKGKYVFTSDYAIGVEGPSFPVVLIHYDADHIRSELIAGAVMFVLLGALGGVLIWKSSRGPKFT